MMRRALHLDVRAPSAHLGARAVLLRVWERPIQHRANELLRRQVVVVGNVVMDHGWGSIDDLALPKHADFVQSVFALADLTGVKSKREADRGLEKGQQALGETRWHIAGRVRVRAVEPADVERAGLGAEVAVG